MARFINPTLFSAFYCIDHKKLDKLGVFDPILNYDSRVFIDPLLIRSSKHKEIRIHANHRYTSYYGKIIKLLKASKFKEDIAWRSAKSLMKTPEIKGTCLGYGLKSIKGSSVGKYYVNQLINTSKQVVDLGITDPDLFTALMIFEEGIGPDFISDITTNIILKELFDFNERILNRLNLKTYEFSINGHQAKLPRNPFYNKTPIILVPTDILRDLPIARDRSEIDDVVSKNRQLRERVNNHIGKIWQLKTLKDKAKIRSAALSSKEAFSALLDVIKESKGKPYDFQNDAKGINIGLHIGLEVTQKNPLKIKKPIKHDLNSIRTVVNTIVEQYNYLIEKKGLWKELWDGFKPRKEKSAQRLFFAISDSYCKQSDLDISPETDSGAGPIDFKFSGGYHSRVLVELKLSKSNDLYSGYEKQLEAYKKAEESINAIYLVIDLGDMERKKKKLFELRDKMVSEGKMVSDIVIVDGTRKSSASKL